MNIEKTRVASSIETIINSQTYGIEHHPCPYCISLWEVCQSLDIKHLKTQEVQEVARYILRRNPLTRAVRSKALHFVDADSYIKSIIKASCYLNAVGIQHDNNGFLMLDKRYIPKYN